MTQTTQVSTNNVPTNNQHLIDWVGNIANLTKPDNIHWCDGSEQEREMLINVLLENKTVVKLNQDLRPDSYLAFSDPSDVARVEDRTFICSKKEIDAGPTNNWMDPEKMQNILLEKFDGSMAGRL